MGGGFTWETQNKEADQAAANKAWDLTKSMLQDPTLQLVVLDEMTYMFKQELLDLNDVIAVLQARPTHQNVIITGRGAPQALIDAADTVSEVKDIKHAFRQGIKAQPGIEF